MTTTALPSPIRRPGVDVVQSIRQTDVVNVKPTLQEVIVGPCYKVLEVTNTDGSLNEDARVSLPAIYQGLDMTGVAATTSHTAIATDVVTLSLPGSAPLVITFSLGSAYTPATAAAFIQAAADVAGLPIIADTVALSSTNVTLRIRTINEGSGAALTVAWHASATMPASGANNFHLPFNWTAIGYDRYDGTRMFITKDMLPDPWNLGDDLDIIESSVRGFQTTATNIKKELWKTAAVDRTVSSYLGVVDDGDGDGTSPLVRFVRNAVQAVYPNDMMGQNTLATLLAAQYGLLSFSGANTITRTVGSWITDGYAVPGTKVVITNAAVGGNNITFTVVSATPTVLTTVEAGALEAPGIVATVNGYTYPEADATLTGFSATPTRAVVLTGPSLGWPLPAGPGAGIVIEVAVDGWQAQRITVNNDAPGAWTRAQVAAEINKYFPGVAADTGAQVSITSQGYGREGVIRFRDISGPDNLFPGGTTRVVARGDAQTPLIGDELWVGNTKLGIIAQLVTVDGTGTVDQIVRLDTELAADYFSTTPWSSSRQNWFIESKNLTAGQVIAGGADKTTPELSVTTRFIQFRQDDLRGSKQDPMYMPLTPTDVLAYAALFYKGLRLDVTVAATTRDPVPVQINASDFTGLDTQFAPLDAQNPLGLAGYLALLNAGQTPIYLFGVDEVSDTYPDGTPDAYARAFNALRSLRCYGVVPLSQDLETAVNLYAHIDYMSATKRRGERYGFVTFPIPERDEDELVGSGTEGNAAVGGVSPNTFNTGLADLGDLFLAAGITTTSGWGPDSLHGGTGDGNEVFLRVEGLDANYLVTGYSGAQITCRKKTATEDSFYYSGNLWPNPIVDKTFSIYIRGAELVDTAGNPDRSAMAVAMGKRCTRFKDRRIDVGAPGEVEVTVNGLAQRLPTYYLAAGQVAMRCGTHPAKPLTNAPLQGYNKVYLSNGYFAEDDMDQAAGYGLWWWINDEVSATVVTRQQLTTDPTSVKTREDSIRTAVDFGSYAIRDALAPIVGTMNITSATLDMLSMVVNGVIDFLVSTGVWIGAKVTKLVQGPFDATAEDLAEGLEPGGEDEVLIEVEVTVGNPLNRIRVRLVI